MTVQRTKESQNYINENKEQWEQIGRDLLTRRIFNGLSLEKVATYIGVSRTTLSNFENGKPIQRAKLIHAAYHLYLLANENNLLPDNNILIN